MSDGIGRDFSVTGGALVQLNARAPDSRLSVVIVNYLAYDPLANCLESLAPFVAPADVVVVDHQTQRAIARTPRQRDSRRCGSSRIAAIQGSRPGVNRGVRETAGEYVLLLNPDCLVASDPRPLASWLAAHPKAGGLRRHRPRSRRIDSGVGAALSGRRRPAWPAGPAG